MALKSFRKEFGVAIGAGEAAIRIDSDEIDDALSTITEVCKRHSWELRVWDHTVGVRWYTGTAPKAKEAPKPQTLGDALASGPANTALSVITEFLADVPQPDTGEEGEVRPVILVMKNFHLAFEVGGRGPVVSAVQHLITDKVGDHPRLKEFATEMQQHSISVDSDTGKFLVGIMPAEAKLPPEVRPLFKVITHELPDEEELLLILDGVLPQPEGEEDDAALSLEVRKKVCQHALGLTRLQATGVFSACVVQFSDKNDFADLLPEFVWKSKSEILNAEGLVNLYQGKETFDDIVGLNGLKDLLSDLLDPDAHDPDNTELRSKGICIVGPPRTGKSLTAKAIGNKKKRPPFMVDIGAWFGQYVGETEAKTRKGFQILRANAPCIAIIDEVEKVMPSARAGSEGGGDGGISRRLAGTFMTKMQDITEDIFWVFTANSVEELHEAFLADDRVDGVVYVDMPQATQLAGGWKMYLKRYFPEEINGKAFAGHLETSFKELIKALGSARKIDPVVWGNRFVAALMCIPAPERETALKKLAEVDSNVEQTTRGLLFKDAGWTIARVKSVCRLARKRKKTLSQVASTMPRTSEKLIKAIRRLRRWATDEAIDAETGGAYEPPAEADDTAVGSSEDRTKRTSTKVRRKVRRVD